jgi:hypothetical protein
MLTYKVKFLLKRVRSFVKHLVNFISKIWLSLLIEKDELSFISIATIFKNENQEHWEQSNVG